MRHGIVVFAFVLAAGLLLSGDLDAGNLEPPGPPAPTMKTLSQVEARTPISSLPFVISTPGSYYLTGDLTGVTGQVGINITSSFVTLDLNGFSLVGVSGSLDGIRANVVGSKRVVVRNGTIRNWGGLGISASNVSQFHAEDLLLDANGGFGLAVGQRSTVRDTTSTGNFGHGIEANLGSTIIGCTAAGNVGSGIMAGGNSVVTTSTATSNGETGIYLNSGSTAIDCTVQQNTTGFVVATGSRVVQSVARLNVTGIIGLDGATIEHCTSDANSDDGIRMGNRGIVRGNFSRANLSDGIYVSGNENRIEDNETTQNSNGYGLRVDGTNNFVLKNTSTANSFDFGWVGGNRTGEISVDPATAGPWANFR